MLPIYRTKDGQPTNVVFVASPHFYFGSVLHEASAPAARWPPGGSAIGC